MLYFYKAVGQQVLLQADTSDSFSTAFFNACDAAVMSVAKCGKAGASTTLASVARCRFQLCHYHIAFDASLPRFQLQLVDNGRL
jgi:hypothetical protein